MAKEAVLDRGKLQGMGEPEALRKNSTALSHLHSLEGFEFPTNGDLGEQKGWFTINSILGTHESYPQTSRATTYVQERLNVIAGGEKAKVVVIHDEAPNAMAMPGYVVVTDGILKIIEHQEELDGLLAHEWIHIDHEHNTDRSKTGTVFGKVGRSRVHETEADLLAMELLDKRGINVRGMMSLFEKLETRGSKDAKKSRFRMGDIEHGSLLDRRLNLEELLWLMDVRNVSGVFTPVALEEENLDDYQRDEELWKSYDQLDPLSKSHFIRRQFNKLDDAVSTSGRLPIDAYRLIELQRNLFQEVEPELPDKDIDNLVSASIISMFPIFTQPYRDPEVFTPEAFQNIDLFKGLDTPDDVIKACKSVESSTIKNLGINMSNPARFAMAEGALASFVLSQETLDVHGYSKLVEEVQPYSGHRNVAAIPLLTRLEKNSIYETPEGREVNSFLAESDIPYEEIYLFVTGSYGTGKDVPEEKSRFVSAIEERRLVRALGIKNPIEFFKYVSRYGEESIDPDRAGDEWAGWHRDIGEGKSVFPAYLKAEVITKTVSLRQMLNKLRSYVKKNELTKKDKGWLSVVVNQYRKTYTQGVIEAREDLEDRDKTYADAKLKTGNISDRLLMWAIGMDKKNYLEQIREDITLLISRFRNKSSVENLVENILSAPAQAKDMGFPVDWEITQEDLSKIESLTNLILKYSLGSATGGGTINNKRDSKIVVDMLENFSVGSISAVRFSEPDDYKRTVENWSLLLNNILSKKELTDQDRLELFALGVIADNVQVNLQIPQAAMEQLVRGMSFEKAVHTVFDRFNHLPQHLFSRAIEYMIEYKARTPEEMDILENAIRTRVEGFLQNDELVGKMALADGLLIDNYASVEQRTRKVGPQVDTIKGMEPVRLLHALLTTSIDDKAFKKYLFERWWLRYRTDSSFSLEEADTEIRGSFQIEDISVWRHPGKEARLRHWANSTPQTGSYKALSELQSDTYLASSAMKYYALRKILTGEHGVLSDQIGREGLINAFLEGWVDFGDSGDGQNVMRELLTSLFTVADKEELYQRINPILMDLILRIPEHSYPYKKLAKEVAEQEVERMGRDGLVRNPTERDVAAVARKVYLLMTGGKDTEETLDTESPVTRLLAMFSDSEKPADDRRLSPIELAIKVGEKSGAVGVRALQLAGQYFDIPEAERERFSNVYDAMKGQTRLQAYRTLKREAQFAPEVAALMNDIAEFHPRIGGGSLMTVYEATLKDGRKEAIAVKNPNVEYHVGKVIDSLRRTMEYAREQNPDNKEYQLFEVLLSDVQEWIINELVDPRFEEKDLQFRMQNDTEYGQFDPGSNRYAILVPQSTPTGTRWVRREEFIEGNNLTSLEPTDEPTDILAGKINREDFKQAISLLTRNYIYQLTETGLVHSDIHPGNFRITPDNASIAVFDRYNLLELDEAEKGLIRSLIPQIAMGGVKAALEHTVNYLFDHERNSELQPIREELLAEVTQNGTNGSLERSIMDAVVTLKQRGVHVPLTISLIAKNLFALNSLAQDAGFQGITDAYTATAGSTELMKLLAMGSK